MPFCKGGVDAMGFGSGMRALGDQSALVCSYPSTPFAFPGVQPQLLGLGCCYRIGVEGGVEGGPEQHDAAGRHAATIFPTVPVGERNRTPWLN